MSKSFKDRIISFETPPPASAWNNISEELMMNKELTEISDKLNNYTVAPPADSWNLIHSAILNDDQKLVRSYSLKTGKTAVILGLTAVAAIVAVIIIGISYFNTGDVSPSTFATNHPSGVNSEGNKQEKTIKESPPVSWEPDSDELSESPVASTFKINKNQGAGGKTLQNTIVKNTFLPANESQIEITAKPIRNAKGEIIQNPVIIDNSFPNYISVTSPNGQQTKISSKFLHVLLFLNDDSDIDQVDGYFDKNFLESLTWKSRFRDWRNEILHTPFIPSSANFMDILDLKDLLTKEK